MFDFFGNIGTAIGSMFVADQNTPAGTTVANQGSLENKPKFK